MNRRVFPLCLVFVLLFASGCFGAVEQEEYITIGALLPLTGEMSYYGILSAEGLQVAKNEINENGGVLGKKIDLIILDDENDAQVALVQYEELKAKGAAVIIGSTYSGLTEILAQAAFEDGIPLISPTATASEITVNRPNVFRAIFIDEHQASAMAEFALKTLNVKTAVLIKNENHANLYNVADMFADYFTEFGGKITAAESFSAVEELAEIINKYKDEPPDAFYYPEYDVSATLLVEAALEAGLSDTVILGSDGWEGFQNSTPKADEAESIYFPVPFYYDTEDEHSSEFVKAYFETFSLMPVSYAANAYTSMLIAAQAIEKAGNTNWDDVASAIRETDMDSPIGHIRFDENNNLISDIIIIQSKYGVYTFRERIKSQGGAK